MATPTKSAYMRIPPPAPSACAGVTILELMVAIFIFSIVAYSLFQGLHTGDKIHGKAKLARGAAIVASNDAERIRSAALAGVRLQDSVYTETASGVTYTVHRRAVSVSGVGVDVGVDIDANNSAPDINIARGAVTEFEIVVDAQGARYGAHTFKLVQGYQK